MSLHKATRAQAMDVLLLRTVSRSWNQFPFDFKIFCFGLGTQQELLSHQVTHFTTCPHTLPAQKSSPMASMAVKCPVSATGGASPHLGSSRQCQCCVGWQWGGMWWAGASQHNRSRQAPCFNSPFISRSASAKSPNQPLSRLLTFLQSILIR